MIDKIKRLLLNYKNKILGFDNKNFLSNIDINYEESNKKYIIILVLKFPLHSMQKSIVLNQLNTYLKLLDIKYELQYKINILQHEPLSKISPLQNIKNIIAIASGKGGVGKSTVSSNIAISLMQMGMRVGILDADIHGPSQNIIMGTNFENNAMSIKNHIIPIIKYNIKIISIGNLIKNKTSAIIWRGPILSKVIMQLLTESVWGKLDYLVIDLPPGTGDIALTLSSKIPITTSVFVTTPQFLSYSNVERSIKMFNKFNIHCSGIIENMSYYKCDGCNKIHNIFGTNINKHEIYTNFHLDCLALIPIINDISKLGDKGVPIVFNQKYNNDINKIYYDLTLKILLKISHMKKYLSINNVKIVDTK